MESSSLMEVVDGLDLHDFIDDDEDGHLNEFIDLIRSDNNDENLVLDRGGLINGGCLLDDYEYENHQYFSSSCLSQLEDQDKKNQPLTEICNFRFDKKNDDKEDNNEDQDSSAGTNTITTATAMTTSSQMKKIKKKKKKKKKREDDENESVDRSSIRTLICERNRRGKMKEKLYALRSLVPNITKMDKASIVGDAVLYVKELQMKAKKLKAEISNLQLQTSMEAANCCKYEEDETDKKSNKIKFLRLPTSKSKSKAPPLVRMMISKKILQMDLYEMELERGFYYMRIVCNKEEGVATALFKALESFPFPSFHVQTSNLFSANSSHNFVLTATFQVEAAKEEVNLPNLRLWVNSALLNHGFEI